MPVSPRIRTAFEPSKANIDRWLSPDVLRKPDISVAQAKQAIFQAIGRPEGMMEHRQRGPAG